MYESLGAATPKVPARDGEGGGGGRLVVHAPGGRVGGVGLGGAARGAGLSYFRETNKISLSDSVKNVPCMRAFCA